MQHMRVGCALCKSKNLTTNYLAKFAVELRILGKIRVQLAIFPVEDFRDGQKFCKVSAPSVLARGLS
jgi:hypothetical protein